MDAAENHQLLQPPHHMALRVCSFVFILKIKNMRDSLQEVFQLPDVLALVFPLCGRLRKRKHLWIICF